LAQALKDAGIDGHVHSFELMADNVARARSNLASAGVAPLVTLHQGDVQETLPGVMEGLTGVRFAFLDASHLLNDVIFEFEAILPSLSSDAIVVFDNTYGIAEPDEDQRVNGALKKIAKKHSGNLINLEHVSWFTPGLAIWQRVPNL
jgi:predicted O-methyltransferase YrrM